MGRVENGGGSSSGLPRPHPALLQRACFLLAWQLDSPSPTQLPSAFQSPLRPRPRPPAMHWGMHSPTHRSIHAALSKDLLRAGHWGSSHRQDNWTPPQGAWELQNVKVTK